MLEIIRNFKRDFIAEPEEIHVVDARTKPSRVILCGMGGSGITGMVLVDAFSELLRAPVEVVRDYAIPKNAKGALVICLSYSGNTEETLSCFAQAIDQGADVVGIASGGRLIDECRKLGLNYVKIKPGYQPRMALALLLSATVRVLIAKNALAGGFGRVAEAVDHIDMNDCDMRARKLAGELNGKLPWIYSYQFEGIAYRAKTQFNENSKLPCAHQMFPELNHNDIVGWGTDAAKQFRVVLIKNPDAPLRIKERIGITKELIRERVEISEVEMLGASRIERALSTIFVLDMASIMLAQSSNVDPVEVNVIGKLKGALDEKNYKFDVKK